MPEDLVDSESTLFPVMTGAITPESGTKPLPDTVLTKISGGRLNKKDGLTRYGDSHVKDKTS